jgi:chorismate mutase-like protein
LAAQPEEKYSLADLVEARLIIMSQVAQYKYAHWHAIEDKEREHLVIEKFITLAEEKNISKTVARKLISSQITSAKALQTMLIDNWKEQNVSFKRSPDLKADIRPRIDQINRALVQEYAEACSKQETAKQKIRRSLNKVPESMISYKNVWAIAISDVQELMCQ